MLILPDGEGVRLVGAERTPRVASPGEAPLQFAARYLPVVKKKCSCGEVPTGVLQQVVGVGIEVGSSSFGPH
jgi:hypothetical protein